MMDKNQRPGPGPQVILWEFRIRDGMEGRFEQAYGPDGDWVKLFRQGEGFVRTELLRDPTETGRYLTLDYWTSEEAYERFRQQHAKEYQGLDSTCEALTWREAHLGSWVSVAASTGPGLDLPKDRHNESDK